MRVMRAVWLTLFSTLCFVACSSGGGGGISDGGLGLTPDGNVEAGESRDARGRSETSSADDAGEEEEDSAVRPKDSGPDTKKTDSSGVCVPMCNSDFECQSSCPASPVGGTTCCDVATGVCYATTAGGSCGGADGGID